MRGLSINVQLVVLIVEDETTTLLVYREMGIVALRKHVQVVPVRQLRPHFYGLPVRRVELPHSVNIRPVTLLTSLAKPNLGFPEITLQVVVYHVEILKGRKFGVGK